VTERSPQSKKRTVAPEVVTLATPPVGVASGERVAGRYTIVEHYGAGPLGHTYRAQDAQGTPVALKVVAHDLAPTPAEREKLLTDVRKLVGQSMPSIAVPQEVALAGNVVCIVSPWVPGRSLRRVLGAYRDAGRAMPLDEVLGVLEGVVQALRQLHVWGAHGAIYPESVQIRHDGPVVLTDAGIAGAVARGRVMDHFERYPDVIPYLSPEIRGGRVSSAGSDLYALGALASELLTGDPGVAAAGIAGPMLGDLPSEIGTALAELVALERARRAAALPVLLEALARAVGVRTVPATAALPTQRGRTDVWPVVPPQGGLRRPRTKRG
jgi:serine/threonine-protein kinase